MKKKILISKGLIHLIRIKNINWTMYYILKEINWHNGHYLDLSRFGQKF